VCSFPSVRERVCVSQFVSVLTHSCAVLDDGDGACVVSGHRSRGPISRASAAMWRTYSPSAYDLASMPYSRCVVEGAWHEMPIGV
jgi:hypothetical protein